MNEDRALEQQFLDRAKALSNVAEVSRCLQVTMLICEMVAFGVRAEAKIFEAAYGDPSGQKYWDAHLSEPIRVYTLAHVLSCHLGEQADEHWFTGDTTPLLAVEDGQTNFQELTKIKLHPRPAVEWLLSKPKREHLVPTSLQRFLQSGGEPTNAKVPTARWPATKKKAEGFAADFIKSERAAGRSPTLSGLEAAAKNAGMRGGREYRRDAFRRLCGVRRGRPPKATPKIAEK
jgi:hypothetical protein